ncbi:protein ABHD13-like [Bolinopsis microptera]|uniref:protein ABHD13-like n=1 Tax=Bolinopsis microptera TaxID=2820187 RepID=UPI00307AF078
MSTSTEFTDVPMPRMRSAQAWWNLVVHTCCRTSSASILILLLMYWLYSSWTILVLLVLAIFAALYQYQDTFLYFPDQPESSRVFVQTPNTIGLPYENIYIKTKDGVKINAVFIKQPANRLATAPTVIFLHGNAGNVGHRLINAKALHSFCGCNIFLLEWRGFGKSDGLASEYGMKMDAEGGLEFLLSREDIDRRRIIVYGRSLGGGVAVHLSASKLYQDKIFALILENTFTSIPEMAHVIFPLTKYLPLFCYRNKFLSVEEIKRVSSPTLFISGMADTLVPPKMTRDLYTLCGSTMKRIECFESGTHNGTWQCYGYYEALNRFLAEVIESLHPNNPKVSEMPGPSKS